MKFLRFLLLLLTFTAAARAASFEEASAAYAAGDFAKAAGAYDELIASSGPSAPRLYNLGNARFRLGEHGPAVLAYERAALLAPHDSDIRANLKLARDAAKSPAGEPARRWWELPLHWLSLREWSWLATGGAVLLTAALCLAAFSRKQRLRAISTAAVAVAFTGLAAAALIVRSAERQFAVATAASPRLLLSPFPEAESAGKLNPGQVVRVEKTEKGWHYVRSLTGGLKGWLPVAEAPLLMGP